MANKNLFPSVGNATAPADTVNNAGGAAYSLPSKHALAQLAVTGCMNSTFYASGETQLKDVLTLAASCDPEFLGKLAVYSRTRGYMKDMPALLLAVLAARKDDESRRVFKAVFPTVVNNTKMLRNFAQIVRSGVTGRKSFGSLPKRLMRSFFASRLPDRIFQDSIGDKPSLADIIKMVHPEVVSPEHGALYRYLLGKDVDASTLPHLVREYETFKALVASGQPCLAPKVPFQMLSSLPGVPDSVWVDIAANAGWHMTRMNLNTFARHGVFKVPGMTAVIAARLRDPKSVRDAKVFPYQLLTTFQNISDDIPMDVRLALQDAMETATENVAAFPAEVVVAVDVSGSMASPVTGHRAGSTTKTRCVDVAALVASTILRTNPGARVMPFDTSLHRVSLNPRDSVMTNATTLARFGGGGTSCSVPLAALNAEKAKASLVIYVSDNESWMDPNRARYSSWYGAGTSMANEWKAYKSRNPKAKLVCIDITPNETTQVQSGPDVLNIGGFSDAVFDVIREFVSGDTGSWLRVIEATDLVPAAKTVSIPVDLTEASE